MINVVALENTEIHGFMSEYNINTERVESSNQFVDDNGNEIKKLMGIKTTISCSLKKVPQNIAAKIAEIVKLEKFNLTYTTPVQTTEMFKCTSYSATPYNSDPRQKDPLITDKITWNISLSMESVELAGNGDP